MKKKYDQIRYLDETGMEAVRINFKNGCPEAVPAKQLQNKANRYYFKETLEINEN